MESRGGRCAPTNGGGPIKQRGAMQPTFSKPPLLPHNTTSTRPPNNSQQQQHPTMEDLQRRKRPVTYGKPTRKRLSIIDDIFSPTAPASRPTSTTVDSPAPPKLSGRAAAKVTDNAKEKLQSSAIDKKRSVPQPAVAKSLKVAARASTRTATTDEESAIGRTEQAAGARAQIEAPTLCKDNLSIFDLPDDGDNDREPVCRFPVKRPKRDPAAAAKPPPKAKAKADKPPAEKLKPADAVEPVVRTKASRTTRSKREEESVPKDMTRPIKAATTAKISKLSNDPLRKARKAIQIQAQTRLSPSETPTPPAEASITRGSQKRSKVDTDSARPRLVPAEKTAILAKPKAAAQPKVSSGKNIKVPTEQKGPPKVTKPKRAKKGSSSKPRASRSKSKSKSKSKSPPNESKSGEPGFWEVFRAGIAASSPPRKRLIDTLGDDSDHPRKKSRSPSGNSVNRGDSPGDNQSQPMFTFDSQQMTLEIERGQEFTAISVQRPVGGTVPRVTYARQRSYRVEESGSLDDLLSMPISVAKSTVPGRRRLVAPNPAVGESKEAKRTKTTIRSIHEMRAAGEYNRFVDDVEELFQDIEGIGPISARRSS
jgi:hypothetical protein